MATFTVVGTGPMASLWAEAVVAAHHSLVHPAAPVPDPADRQQGGQGATVSVLCGEATDRAGSALALSAGGAAVVIESPLAATLEEADELVAASQAGARLACAANLLFAPLVLEAIHRAGGLGPAHFVGAHAVLPRPGGSGGAVLAERGPQVLALLLALCRWERPREVQAWLTGPHDQPETAATVELRLASGARCRADLAWAGSAPVSFDVQLATAASALRLELLPDPHLEQLGVDLPPPPRRWPAAHASLESYGYLDQVQHLSETLPHGRAPRATVELGRALLDVVCAAAYSAGAGEAQPLPFTGRRDLTSSQLFGWGKSL